MDRSITFFIVVRYKDVTQTFRGRKMYDCCIYRAFGLASEFVDSIIASRGIPDEVRIERIG